MSSSSQSSVNSSSDSESDTSSKDLDTDSESEILYDMSSEISSVATEPSTFSSPEPVKIKHAKCKKVKKLKHRKQKSKHAYESSDEESDVPKQKKKD